jgi:hypothetical protein
MRDTYEMTDSQGKTEWDTDEHGYTRIRILENTQQKLKTRENSSADYPSFVFLFFMIRYPKNWKVPSIPPIMAIPARM